MGQLWKGGKLSQPEISRVLGCGMYGGDLEGMDQENKRNREKHAHWTGQLNQPQPFPLSFSQIGRILLRGETKSEPVHQVEQRKTIRNKSSVLRSAPPLVLVLLSLARCSLEASPLARFVLVYYIVSRYYSWRSRRQLVSRPNLLVWPLEELVVSWIWIVFHSSQGIFYRAGSVPYLCCRASS